ncbi:unnamed protein product [Rotaria sordida]|nr:unnamed protein product [Rotaria sordida]CAF1111979.1 unnamed protein product [Rotaria sordida]
MMKTKEAKTKKSDELEDDDEYDYIKVPPDGGFGWVVLIACFLINMIIDGFLYAFGAISDDLKQHFACKEWAVSLVIAIACSCYLLSAPLASALCNKWGCRPIGIIGGIIAALSVAASVYAPSIRIMWLLFGFIAGIGMGLVYLPSIVMVGYYFEKKRAIATGIVTAGTGIGSIAFGPFSRFLFDKLGWKYGLLILACILSGCALCALFMRPLKPIRKRRILEPIQLLDANTEPAPSTTSALLNENKEIGASHSSHEDLNTLETATENRLRANSAVSTKSRQSIKAEDAIRPMYQEDILYPGNVQQLPEYQAQPDLETYVQETTKVPETNKPTAMKAFWDTFLAMTNINVLNDKKMSILCLANICSMIGFYIPYLFIMKMAINERKIPEHNAVYLLSLIGFSNTAIRFASGWLTRIPYLTPLLANNLGLAIAGVVTLLVPFCSTYRLLVSYCIVWGGAIAFHISLTPVIVCQLVGLEKYSSALSLVFMFRGIASLIAPPIMGAIQDYTSSFNVPFVISGISFIVSSLLHFVLMAFTRQSTTKSKKKEMTVTTTNV